MLFGEAIKKECENGKGFVACVTSCDCSMVEATKEWVVHKLTEEEKEAMPGVEAVVIDLRFITLGTVEAVVDNMYLYPMNNYVVIE